MQDKPKLYQIQTKRVFLIYSILRALLKLLFFRFLLSSFKLTQVLNYLLTHLLTKLLTYPYYLHSYSAYSLIHHCIRTQYKFNQFILTQYNFTHLILAQYNFIPTQYNFTHFIPAQYNWTHFPSPKQL